MQLSYFGPATGQLLGLYHPPAGPVDRDAAVLVCHSAPQEYMWSHWAMRQLASKLAGAGFHAFRFDYHGTGDSAGSGNEVGLERWRRDVADALEELKDVSGVRRPSLVGFRLGAALAAQTSARVRDLVLWEPVVVGSTYLHELRRAHERQFAASIHRTDLPREGPVRELMGHPLPAALEAELEEMRIAPPFSCTADRIVVVAEEALAPYVDLVADAKRTGATAQLDVVPGSIQREAPFLLSTRGQDRIVKLLGGETR